MKHELKLLSPYFDPMLLGFKNFEVRFNDRGYEIGDELILREWTGAEYTGRSLEAVVTFILDDARFLRPGYVVLGLMDVKCVESYFAKFRSGLSRGGLRDE